MKISNVKLYTYNTIIINVKLTLILCWFTKQSYEEMWDTLNTINRIILENYKVYSLI